MYIIWLNVGQGAKILQYRFKSTLRLPPRLPVVITQDSNTLTILCRATHPPKPQYGASDKESIQSENYKTRCWTLLGRNTNIRNIQADLQEGLYYQIIVFLSMNSHGRTEQPHADGGGAVFKRSKILRF